MAPPQKPPVRPGRVLNPPVPAQPETTSPPPTSPPTPEETLPDTPPAGYGAPKEPPVTVQGSMGKIWRAVAADLVRNFADSLCGTFAIDRETMGAVLGEVSDEFCSEE